MRWQSAHLSLKKADAMASRLNMARNIGVFRALQLGDMLCSVPALRALRAAAPDARITLIGLPWAAGFARRFGRYIDAYARFPGFPGLPEYSPELANIAGFISAMQAQRFDFLLQMHGSGVLTNPLCMTFGAGRNAGFYQEGSFCPDPQLFLPWDEGQHEVLRNLQLLEFLGVPGQGADLEFPLDKEDFQALRSRCADLPAPGAYVCIHPGARMASRRWPGSRFAQVADRLWQGGLAVVLTGSAQEDELVQAVARQMHGKPLNLCGKTGLDDLAALVAQARLVVCNDTGISHIAAALGTPSVVVCCGADPKRWAPRNRRRHRTVFADVPCRPCAYPSCPIGHPCAVQVSVDTVLAAALGVLADNPLPVASSAAAPPARVPPLREASHERNT